MNLESDNCKQVTWRIYKILAKPLLFASSGCGCITTFQFCFAKSLQFAVCNELSLATQCIGYPKSFYTDYIEL